MLTAKELAQKLRVSRNTISRWVKRGWIPYWRLPGGELRFDWHAICGKLNGQTR